jgi:monofunctional glycosyltransferase
MLMAIRWVQGSAIDYRWRPLEAISPHLAHAVATAEDARFCEHRGIDWETLNKLMDEPGGPSRGGSTIAMQTAKNLFLWPSRSYVRKAAELPLAAWIDFVWPKPRVIEVYLNIAEWGPGIFGAEAAAQRHFGKPAADLTRNEAALLAAALPNPHERNAGNPGPACAASPSASPPASPRRCRISGVWEGSSALLAHALQRLLRLAPVLRAHMGADQRNGVISTVRSSVKPSPRIMSGTASKGSTK